MPVFKTGRPPLAGNLLGGKTGTRTQKGSHPYALSGRAPRLAGPFPKGVPSWSRTTPTGLGNQRPSSGQDLEPRTGVEPCSFFVTDEALLHRSLSGIASPPRVERGLRPSEGQVVIRTWRVGVAGRGRTCTCGLRRPVPYPLDHGDVAPLTGLEPALSTLTGSRGLQLPYSSVVRVEGIEPPSRRVRAGTLAI